MILFMKEMEFAMPSSYTLGKHFEDFIAAQIASGRYASASEVIRSGLRHLEEHEEGRSMRALSRAEKLDWLRGEIQMGVESGPKIDGDIVMAEMRQMLEERRANRDHNEAA
jgi:antitoxin ParD1/3/4